MCVWGGVGAVCMCVCGGGGQLNLTTINELFSARKLTFSMHNCTYKLDNRRGVTQSNYRVHQHVHYIAILCTGNCRQLCNYDNYSAASVPEYCDCWSESIEGSLAYDHHWSYRHGNRLGTRDSARTNVALYYLARRQ